MVKFLKVSRTSINKWVQTFFEEGPEGLQEKPRTGRPPFLTSEQREQLSHVGRTSRRRCNGWRRMAYRRNCQ
ncbi:helix-turn-helix domain-containing protein [Vibrio parahaemolyticus]